MSTPPIPDQQLEALEKNRIYEDSDGDLYSADTLVVYQPNGYLYHLKLRSRYSSSLNAMQKTLKMLYKSLHRPTIHGFLPSIRYVAPRSMPALVTLPNGLYIEKPRSINWDRTS